MNKGEMIEAVCADPSSDVSRVVIQMRDTFQMVVKVVFKMWLQEILFSL